MSECNVCNSPLEIAGRRGCKECARRRLALYRSKMNSTTKCYYNLRQRLRENRIKEGALWSRKDVEALVNKLQIPENVRTAALELNRTLRYKIVRLDENKPFLPDNCQVVLIGGGS